MNIDSISIYKPQPPHQNISFGAIRLAKYKYLNNPKKDVLIYQLEKTDIDYLKYILQNIEKFFKKFDITDLSTQEILKASVDAGIKILEDVNNVESKAKVLLAYSGNDPSAILIGNAAKIDKNGKLQYSSRKNHAQNETELDGLATWNKNILGEGKAILCEYFHTLLEDGFKQVYVRSEIPKYSFAAKFYKKMGFEALSKKLRYMNRQNDSKYYYNIFDYGDSLILPMKATVQDILKTLDVRIKELKRKPIECRDSLDLSHIEL